MSYHVVASVEILRTIRVICKVTPVFGPALTPYPLFQWYPKSNEILLNLSTKCRNSAFQMQQGSRVIRVVVQAGAMKIYVHSSSGGAQEKGGLGFRV